MASNRLCQRTLSAFKSSAQLWEPVYSRRAPRRVSQQLVPAPEFSLTTWNLDAFSPRPLARAKHILSRILKGAKRPDIIFLQEVTSDVHSCILNSPKIREGFLVTDAEDQTSFTGVPFANMTLLSNKRFSFNLESQKGGDSVQEGTKFTLGAVSRIKLPSKYGRCALSVDIIPPFTTIPCRLINVHFDYLWEMLPYRAKQTEIVANLIQDHTYRGLVAGDFNAIRLEDHYLLGKNRLIDVWIALGRTRGIDAATWGVGVQGLRPGRLDKVTVVDVKAKEIEILRPGLIEVHEPDEDSGYIPHSNHCGLRVRFTV